MNLWSHWRAWAIDSIAHWVNFLASGWKKILSDCFSYITINEAHSLVFDWKEILAVFAARTFIWVLTISRIPDRQLKITLPRGRGGGGMLELTHALLYKAIDNFSNLVMCKCAFSRKGPNYLWHMDGYDKLKPYGFCIHGAIDGYVFVSWTLVSDWNTLEYCLI